MTINTAKPGYMKKIENFADIPTVAHYQLLTWSSVSVDSGYSVAEGGGSYTAYYPNIYVFMSLEDCKVKYEEELASYSKSYSVNPLHKPTIQAVSARAEIKTQQVVTFSFEGSK